MFASWRGDSMRDLTKEPLIDLVNRLDIIDTKLTGLLLRKEEVNYNLETLKMEYNNIIKELHRRFPPLAKDDAFQPKVMKKK